MNVLLETTSNITKAATHTAEQVDDANSSDDIVKRHLWYQETHTLNKTLLAR